MADRDYDIPASVVAGFTIAILAVVASSTAPVAIALDLLSSTSQADLVDNVVITIAAFAFWPALAGVLSIVGEHQLHRRSAPGRSLVRVTQVLVVLALLSLIGLVAALLDARQANPGGLAGRVTAVDAGVIRCTLAV